MDQSTPSNELGTADHAGPSDEELVRAAQSGDRAAFDRLVERHQDRTYALVLRILGDRERALDTTQDVFVKAYTALKSFRGEAAFSTWIYRIALNQARSELRQKQSHGPKVVHLYGRREDDDMRAEEVPDRTYEPTRMIGQQETAEMIQSVLRTLDPEDRELIVLRDVQGLGYDQISRIVERPLGTVKSTLHRARLKFVERYRLAERGASTRSRTEEAPVSDPGVVGQWNAKRSENA
jgi:RNA polymerase sigma-70 factor (ECF subfamily)